MMSTLFQLLFACGDIATQPNGEQKPIQNQQKESDTTKESHTDENKSNKPSVHANTSGMPNLLKGLATDGCDDGPGIYGAADYFYNELTINGNDVIGTETWILFPNKKLSSKWSAEGINDNCKVTWNLKGKTQPIGRKGTLGIRVVNQLISSTCPKEIVNKYEDTGKTITYDVQQNSDGTAKFFFSSSGKYVGSGYHKGNSLQFITEKSCRWF